jgi:hypothetical protein
MKSLYIRMVGLKAAYFGRRITVADFSCGEMRSEFDRLPLREASQRHHLYDLKIITRKNTFPFYCALVRLNDWEARKLKFQSTNIAQPNQPNSTIL